MQPDKHKKFVLFVSMTFVILAVVLIFYVIAQKMVMEKRFSKLQLEAQETVQESASEQNAAELGHMKMMAGMIVSIDSNERSIELDVDPYGENKKYKIFIEQNANIFMAVQEQTAQNPCENGDDCEEALEGEADLTYSQSSFEKLQQDQWTEVYFEKRIDVDSGERLSAVKVIGMSK